ncbi:MAG: hypothetical protein AAF517_12975, partial [Planctomycetota bacterium]
VLDLCISLGRTYHRRRIALVSRWMRPILGAIYSVVSVLFGWWGFRGPTSTWRSLRRNLRGGRDITDDVRRSLQWGEHVESWPATTPVR